MVLEVKPVEEGVDAKVMRVFLKSIEILGGPRKLVELRNLTWLPSLMLASYAIVYSKEKLYSAEKIAEILGTTKQTVESILRADPEVIKEKLESLAEEREEEKKTHNAGALAKLAYREISEGRDEINVAIEITKEAAKSLGEDWAFHLLTKIKGTDFPVNKETLETKLEGMEIKGKEVREILEKLDYPIKTPAELLHKIRVALEGQ